MGSGGRRQFLIATGVLALPFSSFAQQQPKIRRIGLLTVTTVNNDAFASALREFGYIEGKNIWVERRSAEGNLNLLPGMAEDLVRRQVEVIVAVTTPGTQAAKRATDSIPIVFVNVS